MMLPGTYMPQAAGHGVAIDGDMINAFVSVVSSRGRLVANGLMGGCHLARWLSDLQNFATLLTESQLACGAFQTLTSTYGFWRWYLLRKGES